MRTPVETVCRFRAFNDQFERQKRSPYFHFFPFKIERYNCTLDRIFILSLRSDLVPSGTLASSRNPLSNKTLRSVHFGVVVVELINCKCGGIVRNQIW